MKLQIKKTHPDAVTPTRGHDDDAGLDLTAIAIEKELDGAKVILFDTGIAVKPPEGYYCQIVPRSSTSKMGISLANGTGIIDPSYRGSLKLAIRFHKTHNGIVLPEDLVGIRLCQLLIKPLHIAEVIEVNELDDTERGSGGFGSTGVA